MNFQFVIIWVALAISQLVYLFIPVPHRESAAIVPGVFPIALGVITIAQSIGIVAWLRIRAFNPIQAGRLDPTSKSGVAQLFTTLIVAWVLAESVAVYGLVLRFLHFDLRYYFPFFLAGACLLFLARPWSPKLKRASSATDLAGSNAPL